MRGGELEQEFARGRKKVVKQAQSFTAINISDGEDSNLTDLDKTPPCEGLGGGNPSQSAAYFQAAAVAGNEDDDESEEEKEVVDDGYNDDDPTIHRPLSPMKEAESHDEDFQPHQTRDERRPSGCSSSHQPIPPRSSQDSRETSDSNVPDDVVVYSAPRLKFEARCKT